VRYLVDVRAMLKEQLDGLRCGEGRGEMQRRPSVRRNSAGKHGIGRNERMKALAFAQCRRLMDIEVAASGSQEIADKRLPCVDRQHQSRNALGIAAPGKLRSLFHSGSDLGCLSPADHIEEELAHGMSISSFAEVFTKLTATLIVL
jgi:hypothetical protein